MCDEVYGWKLRNSTSLPVLAHHATLVGLGVRIYACLWPDQGGSASIRVGAACLGRPVLGIQLLPVEIHRECGSVEKVPCLDNLGVFGLPI